MLKELKMEHVLMLAIVVFVLYHLLGSCGCRGNGFRVRDTEPKPEPKPECKGKSLGGVGDDCDDHGINIKTNPGIDKDDAKAICALGYYKKNLLWPNYQCNGEPLISKQQPSNQSWFMCQNGTKCDTDGNSNSNRNSNRLIRVKI